MESVPLEHATDIDSLATTGSAVAVAYCASGVLIGSTEATALEASLKTTTRMCLHLALSSPIRLYWNHASQVLEQGCMFDARNKMSRFDSRDGK